MNNFLFLFLYLGFGIFYFVFLSFSLSGQSFQFSESRKSTWIYNPESKGENPGRRIGSSCYACRQCLEQISVIINLLILILIFIISIWFRYFRTCDFKAASYKFLIHLGESVAEAKAKIHRYELGKRKAKTNLFVSIYPALFDWRLLRFFVFLFFVFHIIVKCIFQL